MTSLTRKGIRSVATLLGLAVALVAPAGARAAYGDLDPSFGSSGLVMGQFQPSVDPAAVAVAPDGKIVVAGTTTVNSRQVFAVVRYDADGKLDSTFDGDGTATATFAAGNAQAKAVAVQGDGKIVVVGTAGSSFGVARYETDGRLDASFGSGGTVTTDFAPKASGVADQASDVALQPDGKIVATGRTMTSSYSRFALARYTPNGALDPSFGAGGKAVVGYANASLSAASVAIAPDGSIAAAGYAEGNFVVTRLSPAGVLDPTFDGDGVAVTDFGGTVDQASSVAVQRDGKIVVGGRSNAGWSSGGGTGFALVRYTSSGSLDPGFGSGGKVLTAFDDDPEALLADVAIAAGGKIAAAGSSLPPRLSGPVRFALAQYTSAGALDPSFGSGGKVRTPAFAAGGAEAQSVAFQADGRIIAAGSAPGGFAVARYLDDSLPPLVRCEQPDRAWHADNVLVHCTAVDAGSGLSDPADAAFSLSTSVAVGADDPDAATGSRVICDSVANCVTAGPITGISVDRKRPDVNCEQADGAWHAANVSLGCRAADTGAGLATSADAAFSLATDVPAGEETADAATAERTVCDAVGNCTTTKVGGSKVDRKPPDVSCGGRPNGWQAGNVAVPCTAADGGSALADAREAAFSLSTSVPTGADDPNAATESRAVCDGVGNCVTAGPITGVSVDRKPPEVTCAQPDGAWHAANVSLGCRAADSGAGLAASADADFSLATDVPAGVETADATAERTVCDAVGNCTAAKVGGNKVDRKAPGTSCDRPTGWHADNVAVSCTATDRGSALADPRDAAFSLSTGVPAGADDPNAATDSRAICDGVGNCATAGPITGISVDRKRPDVTCAQPDGAWHAANVSVGCRAADTGADLAAADTAFSLATAVPAGSETADAATAERNVCDAVGNCTAAKVGGNKVDRKPPDVTCARPDGAWHAANVTLGCRSTDAGAGLAATADAGFSLATAVPAGVETADAATAARGVCDAVGNCTTARVGGNKVDRRAPDILIGAFQEVYVLNGPPTPVGKTCQDGGSGLASCVGTAIDTSSVGTKTVTATGTDAVGNSRTATRSYAVAYDAVLTEWSTVRLLDARGANVSSRSVELHSGTASFLYSIGPDGGGEYMVIRPAPDSGCPPKPKPGETCNEIQAPPAPCAIVAFTAGADPTMHWVDLRTDPSQPEGEGCEL